MIEDDEACVANSSPVSAYTPPSLISAYVPTSPTSAHLNRANHITPLEIYKMEIYKIVC